MKKIHIFLACTVFLVLLGSALFGAEETLSIRRYGIFIGSNYGGSGRVQLQYASTDAGAMAEIMSELGGISRSDLFLLIDPDIDQINRNFSRVENLVSQAKGNSRRTEFIFYYSGHSDEEGLLLGDDKYTYPLLKDQLTSIKADVNIAILDSCSSGAFTRLKGGQRRSPFLIDNSSEMKGHAFLTSSSADEAAQESDKIQASFFTHYLISGLRGAADSTNDGMVTLNEGYRYAFDETLARTANTQAGPQHPSYDIQLTGAGDLVLTDTRETNASILLQKPLYGRLFLRNTQGKLVAEVNKMAGIPVALAMPPGEYSITLDQGDDLYEASIILAGGKNVSISQEEFSKIRREYARSRGGDGRSAGEDEEVIIDVAGIRVIIDKDDDNFSLFDQGEIDDQGRRVIKGYSADFVTHADALYGTQVGVLNFVRDEAVGIQFGGVFSQCGGPLKGSQFSGVFNNAGETVSGFQGAGVFNIAKGKVSGGQWSGVYNIAEEGIDGFQGAGVFNITGGDSSIFQGSGTFNINNGDFRGFQGSGVFNMNSGEIKGAQVSGVFNQTESLTGLQMSVVNAARYVAGAQIGVVNVGGRVKGTQIGVINISTDMRGVPIGLLNIEKGNFFHLQTWYDTQNYVYIGAQFGGRFLYTMLYTGMPFASGNYTYTAGAGLGTHFNFKPLYIEIDITAKNVVPEIKNQEQFTKLVTYDYTTADRTFPSLRALLGVKIFKHLSIFGGATLDMQVEDVFGSNILNVANSFTFPIGDLDVIMHPKYYAGIKL